jgi:protein-L-isoaspartate O-methyltransferase
MAKSGELREQGNASDTATTEPVAPVPLPALSGTGLKLFLLGFATLFLELLFIRYLAGTIWNLGYFPNIVLLSVFIGMGVGFVFHDRIGPALSDKVFIGGFGLAVGLILFVSLKHPIVPGFSLWHYNVGGDLYFSFVPFKADDLNYLFFVLCFVVLSLTFACISQRTAKLFRQFKPLDAYTLDILGSCAGILSFIAISALQLPAWSWFILFTVIFVFAMRSPALLRAIPAVLAVAAVFVMFRQDAVMMQMPHTDYLKEAIWSPYQKVEYTEQPDPSGVRRRIIYVNGLNHQEILLNPEMQFYGIPYAYRQKAGLPAVKDVLVIGAGTGNDVTTALRNGATHVDAVEIDPVIAEIGRRHNPSACYSDPRVDLHINDGRAFMTQTHHKYDLIIFALTDSLVKVSSLSQLRLENYLFTRESIERGYSLLNDQGNIVFYNFYRLPFVAQKIYNMVSLVTGSQPQILAHENDFFMLCGQKTPDSTEAATLEDSTPQMATDDWPFLYLETPGIPALYLNAMAGVSALIIVLLVVFHFASRHRERDSGAELLPVKLAFIFMGIAFLLLETKSVIQFSLLFGTTWLNNSLIFFAILVSVLAANWTVQVLVRDGKTPAWLHLGVLYGLLAVSVLISVFYPLHNLLTIESLFLRFLAASLLTFTPIYFANLIFSTSFRDQPAAEHLFGWNLLGATFGGVLEYTGMAMGYNALACIVLGCYTIVFACLVWRGYVAKPVPAR